MSESGSAFAVASAAVTLPALDLLSESGGWRTLYPLGREARPDVYLHAKQVSSHPAWIFVAPLRGTSEVYDVLEQIRDGLATSWTLEELRADDGVTATSVRSGWTNEATGSDETIAVYQGIGSAHPNRMGGTPRGQVVLDPPVSGGAGSVLAAALAKCRPGDTLILNAGTYVLNSDVVLPSGVAVVGRGEVLVRLGTTSIGLVADDREDVILRGLTVDLAASQNFRVGLSADRSTRLRVEGCAFVNDGDSDPEWTLMGVLARDASDVRIAGCSSRGTQYKGGGTSGWGFAVYDCVFDTPVQYGVSFVTWLSHATRSRIGHIGGLRIERARLTAVGPGAGVGFLYIGDDATATYVGDSRVDNVVVRDVRATDVPADYVVFNGTHNDLDHWLIEGIVVTNQSRAAGATAVRIDPRDRSGPGSTVGREPVCSRMTIRDIVGTNLGRCLTWNHTRVAGLTIEDVVNLGADAACWRGDGSGYTSRTSAQLVAEFGT